MKNLKSIVTLLILMISMVVVGSTPQLKQKQKTTFEFVQSVEYYKVANVQTETIAFKNQPDQSEQVFLYQYYEWKELPDSEERNNVIQTAKDTMLKTDCSTCRIKCSTTSNLGGGSYLVHCSNGHNYVATFCEASGWHVSDQTRYLSDGGLPVPYPC